MIPTYNNSLYQSFQEPEEIKVKPVYEIDWENNRLLTKKKKGHAAVAQNIQVITAVEHQEHIAMPDWFGLAMKDMYGMPRRFVKANLERLIKEALSPYLVIAKLYDIQIEDIDKYSFGVSCKIELFDGAVLDEYIKVDYDV